MMFDNSPLYYVESNFDGTRYILYDLAKWKNGLAFKKIDFSDNGGIPVIKIAELNNGLGSTTAYTKGVYDDEVYLEFGDFLFSWSGNPQTSIDIFRFQLKNGWLNQHIFKVTPNESVIYKEFFFYVMKWLKPNFTDIATNKQTTGLGHVTISDLKRLSVVIPDMELQRKIGDFLHSVDRKIALNTAINENLEQQAQAIYRSMFVTLHHDSDRMGLLSELITVKYGKDHKKLNDGVYPVYGSGGIMRYVERPLYDKESVLIPRKGSLNNVMYVNEPFWSVDTMFYTEMKQPNVAKFVFHFVKSKDLASLNAGSAVPSMTTDILNSMELRIPSADRLAEFEGLVAPLYRAIEDNTRQSARLAALRDTLLPKLMSGEIDVSAVQI